MLDPFWHQNGAKLGPKSVQKQYHVEKHGFASEIAIPKAKTPFLGFGGSVLGSQSDQKSIKKRNQNRSAFWDRFFVDFGSILGPFGGAKRASWPILPPIWPILAPTWEPRRAQGHTHTQKSASSALSGTGLSPQVRPRWAKMGPRWPTWAFIWALLAYEGETTKTLKIHWFL